MPLGHDPRGEAALSITRYVNLHRPHNGDQRLAALTVAGATVTTVVPRGSRSAPLAARIQKNREREFDTREELGDGGYVVDVEYAMRLNHGGEFIHATVRSGEELGADNVTHGCINMQEDNAEWLYDLTHGWGDPVIVEGTSRTADLGNGWSGWNYSWEEYQRGSALHEG